VDLPHDHLVGPPMGPELHLMGCHHRERKLLHQSGRDFVLYIYAPVHNFHHNNSKVLACDVPPFRREGPFGP
jgi:hypothetical protein